MEAVRRIEELIAPSLESMGFDVVRVHLGGSQHPILQIMIERRDRARLTLDSCAEVSRAISALLDVEDPLADAYTLEVSSPGIDRPLVRLEDFARFAGFEAKIELAVPLHGRRRFRGRLLGTEGRSVRLELAEGSQALPFDDISRAKLVMTDALLAASEAELRT